MPPVSRRANLLAFVPALVIPLLIAALLWQFPATILGSDTHLDKHLEGIDYGALLGVGVSLLGLYVISAGLLDLASALSLQVNSPDHASMAGLQGQIKHTYVMALSQLALGVVFVVGRRGIAGLLGKARRAGTGQD